MTASSIFWMDITVHQQQGRHQQDAIIKLVRDIADHRETLNSIDEVLESVSNAGHDRLEHRRR